MNMAEAARLLGVAESEVKDLREHAGWWHVLHHDMASHEESWRPVPGAPPAGDSVPGPDAEGSSGPGTVHDDQDQAGDDPDGPGVDENGDGVPEGSARQILEWVGNDRDRARVALDAEQHRDPTRTTLVAALEKLTS